MKANADLSSYGILIIGKEALTPDGPGPDVDRVRDGLKVVVFEQSSKSSNNASASGRRSMACGKFSRASRTVPCWPALDVDHLRDWRGDATILPPRLQYTLRPRYGPTVQWCGIDVPRAWRCGCRGNVASVLIEKPACGDFLPILDGGYDLQYSPLMEYREGKGMVLFCQMDVTGRTEADPAADALTRNLLRYVSAWKPSPRRKALYVGDPAGMSHLKAAGLSPNAYAKAELTPDQVLIVGPGGGKKLAGDAPELRRWLKDGGHILAVGLDGEDAAAFLPFPIEIKKGEHISAYFEPLGMASPLAGVGPADVYDRDPHELPLVSGGAAVIGDGVLATGENGNVVLCQLVPWQFDSKKPMNQKRTFRRSHAC